MLKDRLAAALRDKDSSKKTAYFFVSQGGFRLVVDQNGYTFTPPRATAYKNRRFAAPLANLQSAIMRIEALQTS